MSVTCRRSVVSSTNKTDLHDITEILLKMPLNTITITSIFFCQLISSNIFFGGNGYIIFSYLSTLLCVKNVETIKELEVFSNLSNSYIIFYRSHKFWFCPCYVTAFPEYNALLSCKGYYKWWKCFRINIWWVYGWCYSSKDSNR